MIDFTTLSPYFDNLRNILNDDINITIGSKSYLTSRLLLISHSNKLKECFGKSDIKSFNITDDIDPIAFEGFIEFVNTNKINFANYDIDKLLKIANFYNANMFHDYIVMNFQFIDYLFHQISIYENQGKSTNFLLENLASRIFEITGKWDNAHKVDLEKLLQILRKANLNQLSPEIIYSFCFKAIKHRGKQSIEILKLFNLSKLPIQDLLKLQKVAFENNVTFHFFEELDKMNQHKQQLQGMNDNISIQLQSIQNTRNDNKVSIEFKTDLKQNKSIEIHAIPANNQQNIHFLILAIGKKNVGKTTLINKYHLMKSKNEMNSINNIQIDFLDFDDDEASDETLFAAILKAQMIFFVCSPDVKGSIYFCNSFYEKMLKIKNTEIPSIIYWNKSDLKDLPVENIEEATEFANKIKSDIILVSAKTGDNIIGINNEIMKKLRLNDQKSCNVC